MWSRKISANEVGFRQVSLNNERATVLPLMDTETSNLLVRLHFYGDFQKSVLYCETCIKNDALVLFISAFN